MENNNERSVLTTMTITCVDCGKEFEFYPSSQKFYKEMRYEIPKRCPECIQKKKADATTMICVDCGAEYTVNGYEKEYYTKRGFPLPKRCKPCREIKRNRNNK